MKRIFAAIALIMSLMHASAAKVDTVEIKTTFLDSPMKVCVVTPQTAESRRFPTVYLLNGYGGGYRDWLKNQPRIKELADSYGMIIVTPDGRNSWYWDSPVNEGMQMESFFVKDLVPYIDTHYPTVAVAGKRAISGLSMGGHGAMWLAMRHPDIWGNAGTMSGGVDIRPFPKNWSMAKNLGATIEEDPELWEKMTVINLVPTLKPGELNLTIDCGIDDFFAGVNRNLHEALVNAGIAHDYTSRPGRHSWSYWNNSVLYHLLFFNEAFNKKADK